MRRILVGSIVVVLLFATAGCRQPTTLQDESTGTRIGTESTTSTEEPSAEGTSPAEKGAGEDGGGSGGLVIPPAPKLADPGAPKAALHHPGYSDPERKAILDALRVPVQRELKQKVVFKVDRIAVQDGWAFVYGQPLRPDGGEIDYSRTKYQQAIDEGFFDDNYSALLRYRGGWRVVTYDIGATDVVWEPWADSYGAPKAIFQ